MQGGELLFVFESGRLPWYIDENQNLLHQTASLEAAVAHTKASVGGLWLGLDWRGELFGGRGRV